MHICMAKYDEVCKLIQLILIAIAMEINIIRYYSVEIYDLRNV